MKGLLLIVNSPGGTFVSSKEIFDSIKNIGKRIPTAVYMKEMATSGGYLVSLGAEKIFSNQGTITGSIGVILQTADMSELLKKIGVNPIIIKSGELKSVPNPLEKINQEDDKLGYSRFSRVKIVLKALDWLQLHHKGHKRLQFKFEDEISSKWIAS